MPVREIPIGTRAVTGRHARTGARYESSLERDFFELMTFDPLFNNLEEQPVRISYTDETGKARRYTPDALVTFKADPGTQRLRRPLLCEIKYRDEYRKKFKELRPRLRAAFRYAREREWQFKVITEREIRSVTFANLRFLGGYRDRNPDAAYMIMIAQYLNRLGTTSSAALLASITPDKWEQAAILPTLWWMVAHSQVWVDFKTPLTMQSSISLSQCL